MHISKCYQPWIVTYCRAISLRIAVDAKDLPNLYTRVINFPSDLYFIFVCAARSQHMGLARCRSNMASGESSRRSATIKRVHFAVAPVTTICRKTSYGEHVSLMQFEDHVSLCKSCHISLSRLQYQLCFCNRGNCLAYELELRFFFCDGHFYSARPRKPQRYDPQEVVEIPAHFARARKLIQLLRSI